MQNTLEPSSKRRRFVRACHIHVFGRNGCQEDSPESLHAHLCGFNGKIVNGVSFFELQHGIGNQVDPATVEDRIGWGMPFAPDVLQEKCGDGVARG